MPRAKAGVAKSLRFESILAELKGQQQAGSCRAGWIRASKQVRVVDEVRKETVSVKEDLSAKAVFEQISGGKNSR